MKPGITQLVCITDTTDEFFDIAADSGYEAVEMGLKCEGAFTPDISDDEIDRLARLAAAKDLEIASLCIGSCTGNLLDSGESQRLGIEQTRRALEIADRMGVRCTLHTLGDLRADLYYDDAYRNGIESLKELAITCERIDVRIAIEFVWNGFLFSPMEMKRFLDDVGSTHVGFYFDPGNMAVFQFPHHWVRIVGQHVMMVHIKDWQGGALDGSWPALLEGQVDYTAMNRELRAIGYDGPVISEVSPDVATYRQTADAIRKIIAM